MKKLIHSTLKQHFTLKKWTRFTRRKGCHSAFLFGSLLLVLLSLSACRSQAPRLDYQALAQASIRLDMDIDLNDPHPLYLESARWMGTPYRRGGTSRNGCDCSGLVQQIYRKVYRKKLPHEASEMQKSCQKIARKNLKAGDLVFFTSPRSKKKTGHVGIYLKDGRFIHASTSKGVIISRLDEPYYRKHWKNGGRVH